MRCQRINFEQTPSCFCPLISPTSTSIFRSRVSSDSSRASSDSNCLVNREAVSVICFDNNSYNSRVSILFLLLIREFLLDTYLAHRFPSVCYRLPHKQSRCKFSKCVPVTSTDMQIILSSFSFQLFQNT